MATQRVIFTKEMKRDYTILLPNMLEMHFKIMAEIFRHDGYRVELLQNEGQGVIDCGLKYTHNDACYPALLVIGQFINALQSEEEQEICHQLNRRTEFQVLRTTYKLYE